MRNQVKTIKCKSSIFAEGWGNNTAVFPSAKTFPGLLMLRVTEGVEVSAPGKRSFLIPWGNIEYVDLFEQEYTAPIKVADTNKVSQAV